MVTTVEEITGDSIEDPMQFAYLVKEISQESEYAPRSIVASLTSSLASFERTTSEEIVQCGGFDDWRYEMSSPS